MFFFFFHSSILLIRVCQTNKSEKDVRFIYVFFFLIAKWLPVCEYPAYWNWHRDLNQQTPLYGWNTVNTTQSTKYSNNESNYKSPKSNKITNHLNALFNSFLYELLAGL